MNKISKFLLHTVLFVVVEIMWLYGIFAEIPWVTAGASGAIHVVYWISIPVVVIWSKRFHGRYMRILAYVVPLLVHLGIHIVPVMAHHESHSHDHFTIHSYSLVVGGLLLLLSGEYLLHKDNQIKKPANMR